MPDFDEELRRLIAIEQQKRFFERIEDMVTCVCAYCGKPCDRIDVYCPYCGARNKYFDPDAFHDEYCTYDIREVQLKECPEMHKFDLELFNEFPDLKFCMLCGAPLR